MSDDEQVECDSCGEVPAVWWSDYDEGYCLKCFAGLYEKTWVENEKLRTERDALQTSLDGLVALTVGETTL